MNKDHLNEVKHCYDLTAAEYSKVFLNELDHKPFDRNILDRFSEMICANGLIYDLGCGSGQITKYISDKNRHTITGLDFSENMIKTARKTFPEIKFEVDDMLNSKLSSSSANGILAFYAIVHFDYEQAKIALQEWYRALKDDGYCLFSFHIGEEEIYVEKFLDVEGASANFRLLNIDKILSIAEEEGFKVVDAVIRYPYKDVEYPSKRAYIILEK